MQHTNTEMCHQSELEMFQTTEHFRLSSEDEPFHLLHHQLWLDSGQTRRTVERRWQESHMRETRHPRITVTPREGEGFCACVAGQRGTGQRRSAPGSSWAWSARWPEQKIITIIGVKLG